MKLCVIGNSHIASLKSGWEMVSDSMPGIELVFFGSPGGKMRFLRVRGARLVPSDEDLARDIAFTSGGQTAIVPRDHDAVLLYGLNQYVPRLRRGISRAVVQATLADMGGRGICPAMAQKVRRVTRKPLWVAPAPLETAPQDQHDTATFHDYDTLLTAMKAGFPVEDARFLAQPAQTIGPDLRAPNRWGLGSERLRRPDDESRPRYHDESDVRHMNAEYGALWLRTNLPQITAAA
jgi:hypothetical protein